jgi:hypothetical protein
MFSVKAVIPAVLAASMISTAVWAQEGAPGANGGQQRQRGARAGNPNEQRVPGVPGSGPGATPSAERSVPAETTVAAYKDPKWKAPRTSWGTPSLEGQWSVDDMRGIPSVRPDSFGTRDTLNEQEFMQRARQQQGGDDRARQTETFLRNEWGTRTFGYTSLVVEPANGRVPALTPAGKARADAVARVGTFGPGPFDRFEDFSLYDRCITRGIFGSVLPSIYGNGIRIVQGPNQVSITYEMIHDTRIVDLTPNRPHLDGDIKQYMGNARGHWEGDTLVVESTNFNGLTGAGGRGGASTKFKVIERYRRVDPEMIEYRATVDDPETYTAPFTYRVMFTKPESKDYEVYEYSCHEGNGAVVHALSGERAYEKQVEEAKAKGLPIPKRGGNLYGPPEEGSRIFNINAGE